MAHSAEVEQLKSRLVQSKGVIRNALGDSLYAEVYTFLAKQRKAGADEGFVRAATACVDKA